MEVSKVIDFDYDDLHDLGNVVNGSPDKAGEVLEELSSATEASATESYEDVLTGDEKDLDDVFWGVLAALCFLAGLAVGLLFHFKSNWVNAIGNYLQRCCPRLFTVCTVDPVLLTVVERKTRDENEVCDDKDGPESGSKDAEMSEASGEVELAGGGGQDSLADEMETGTADQMKDRLTEADDQMKDTLTEANEQTKNHLTEAADQIKATEAAQDGQKTEDASNVKVVCDKSSSSSSSSSSSEAEGDEERSVRHRKKTTAEASVCEDGATESDDKDDGQHKE